MKKKLLSMPRAKQNRARAQCISGTVDNRNLNTKTNLTLIKLLNFKVKRDIFTHPNGKSEITRNGDIGLESVVTLTAENRGLCQSSERKKKARNGTPSRAGGGHSDAGRAAGNMKPVDLYLGKKIIRDYIH